MKVKEIYDMAVQLGIKVDPRGKDGIAKILKDQNDKFKDLKDEEKELFDQDQLTSPYNDTKILYSNGKDVKKALAGIDIEAAELLLADRLNEKGLGIDLVIGHHPEGKSFALLSEVMDMQSDIAHNFGVPINVAESIMGPRIGEVARSVHSFNHQRPVDAARLLDINFMNIHTPADNNVQNFLQTILDEKKPEKVSDVIKVLKEIPEFKEATKLGAGPVVFCGSESRRAGKVMVEMTGGTGGQKEVYQKLANAGVGTIVGMHIGEEGRKEAEANHINVVIAGHIASDSIGMNIIMDELEKKGLEIIPCSGFIRVKR